MLFGGAGALIYSIAIAISAMGALNANVFATAVLCVAASKRSYFPKIFANLHCSAGEDESNYYRRVLQRYPAPLRDGMVWFSSKTAALRLKRSVPMWVHTYTPNTGEAADLYISYAMLVNGCIACFYIVIGTFNGLVTFIGTISQPSSQYT